jgi:hypothetical protein
MPIEATPFEQEVVLEAMKLTDVPWVLLLAGLVTVTPAKADEAAKTHTTMGIRACFFIRAFSPVGMYFL